MYIMLLEPDYQERVWGGQKLKTYFHKEIPFQHTGESWEVACHDNGHSVIKNGDLKGMRLKDAVDTYSEALLGYSKSKQDKFPLLLKFIDAKDQLSVQVHPEDAYAYKHEKGELGKTEAWYIVDAEPGSKLIVGLKEGVSKKTFIDAFESDRLEEVLNEVVVQKGDVINIPAGLIHAIGTGILLAEVQQNSDTTYRVYDWKRVGLDGKQREMHVEKSLDVIDFEGKHSTEIVEGVKATLDGYELTRYISNPYFVLEKLHIPTQASIEKTSDQFELFMCLEGEAIISCETNTINVVAGDSFMIPACVNSYKIKGSVDFIKTFAPKCGQKSKEEAVFRCKG